VSGSGLIASTMEPIFTATIKWCSSQCSISSPLSFVLRWLSKTQISREVKLPKSSAPRANGARLAASLGCGQLPLHFSPLELRFDGNQNYLGQPLPPGPVGPHVPCIGRRGLEVRLEDVRHILSKSSVIHIQAGFIVEFE